MVTALQKMLFLDFFCLVFSLNIKKFLYQEALSKQAKHIVLFKEINMPKLCEFFLWNRVNDLPMGLAK